MRASYQQGKNFPAGMDEVFQACVKAVSQCGFRIGGSDPEIGQIEARSKMSMRSWGEKITITTSAAGRVDIKSTCYWIQVVDWGKTRLTLTHCFLRSGSSCRLNLSSKNAGQLPADGLPMTSGPSDSSRTSLLPQLRQV